MREQEILGYRYRLVDELGAGGMGVVWRAYDQVLDRHVAVKVLAPEFARDAEFRQRVLTEARAAGRLTHPHIAGVYDYGESMTDVGDRVPYVVMELLQGRSLHERLKRGPVTVEHALRICAEVASALAAAHAHGLVHRDVKPGNVMLTPSGAKVVDFGLAAVAGERDAADGTELMLGTPAYLAPERLAGQPVVAGTDVYALGLLLYRMLAGRAPWSTETTTQMLHAHVYFQPDPLPRVRGVPPVVTDLVHRCLVKDPGGRPSSREVAATLAHAAGIRVPLDLVDDDDLADPHGDHGQSSGGRDSGGSGGSGRGKATVRPDPLAPLPPGLVSAGDPFVLRLGKHLDSTLDHVTLRRQASVLLRGVVPFDLAIWAVLDPVTLMWASCVVDGGPYDERFEHELFANEYGQDDVLRLVDLAEGPRVGTLLAGTQGDPRTSRRFRNILQPRGFTDELRLAFYDNDGTWGALLLFRVGGQFTEADVAQLAPAARPFGSVLHQTLVRGDPPTEVPQPDIATPPKSSASRSIRIPMPRRGRGRRAARPESRGAPPESAAPVAAPVAGRRTPVTGQVTISGDGRLLDVTEGARALLDAVQLDRVGAAVARGRTLGLVDATASGRHDGRWLAFHARPQRTSIDVTVGRIRPHQVSEFVTQSLGLEPWHFRLLGAVARNRDTRQIAQDLETSAYDVQDGMVSLFSAFGVTGRIELVKALFFDHYVPMHAADARVSPD